MTVLAIETAGRAGSVAVADESGVLAARAGDAGRPPPRAAHALPASAQCADATVAGVWMDAARGEVFAARFRRHPSARAPLGEPVSAPPDVVGAAWAREDAVDCWIGDGAVRYRQALRAGHVIEPVPLLAPLVARLALRRRDEAGSPHALRPLYVRPPDAELARQR